MFNPAHLRGGKTGQSLPAHFDAQSGALGHANYATDMLKRPRQNGLTNWVLRPVELQYRLDWRKRGRRMCWHNGQELQGCGDRNACSPDMRIVPDAECSSHVGDLLAFGQPTRGACVWLDDVHRVRDQQFAEAKPREFSFAPRDRDRKRGFHGSISHQVFGRHRFLEPSDIMPLDLPAEPDRVHGVVSMVRINHQRNIGSDG